MDKDTAVSAWLFSGIFDLYVGFSLEDYHFFNQKVFYSAMGLEKILKSYFIYEKAAEYESLSDLDAKIKIEKIAKQCGHNYKEMIDKIKADPEIEDEIKKILNDKFYALPGENGEDKVSFNGEQFLDAVQAGYQESRYPTAIPISDKFKVSDTMSFNPMGSSDLIEFIYKLSKTVISNLKTKVDLNPRMESVEAYLSPNDRWTRFKNIYFNETNGDIEAFFS